MSETDFRYYLDKLIKGIDDKFSLFTKQQDRIELKVDDLRNEIETMKMNIAKQYDNCQNTTDVKELKKNVEKHNTIFGNWKLYLIAGAVFLVGAMIVINEKYVKIKEMMMPNTEFRLKQDSIQGVKDTKEIKSILK